MTDPRDYKLDLSSAATQPNNGSAQPAEHDPRPYLSVQFACCGVYVRIYKSADGQRYTGHCPKCAKPASFRIGHGGTDARQFIVY